MLSIVCGKSLSQYLDSSATTLSDDWLPLAIPNELRSRNASHQVSWILTMHGATDDDGWLVH